jgi:ATP adenylyltransferase
MKQMFSPWRSKYMESFKTEKSDDETTFISRAINSDNDFENLVLARFEHCIVILNKYPYNNGHVLIAPKREVADISNLSSEEFSDINNVLQIGIEIIKKVFSPHGYNIGVNVGEAAGAGVPRHLHYHIVPRWRGDSNFMPVLSDIKVVSQSLEETTEILTHEFKKYTS